MAQKWTKERVVVAIRSRHRQRLPLTGIFDQDPRLYGAAYRLFGGWYDAVLAAGQKPYLRRWSKQRILDAIQARQQRGLPMSGILKEDPPLYAAGRRHFGCWRNALLAAGLPVKPRRRWTREDIIATIQERHRQGLPLANLRKVDRPLVRAARAYFGGWHQAVRVAGIPDGWQHKWNRQRVIDALKACNRLRQSRSSQDVSAAVRGAAFFHFGNWHDALVAAGLVPSSPRPPSRTRWTRARVLSEIRAGSVPGAPMTVAANPKLAAAARKRFGSWRAALVAAGVEPRPSRTWSPERVLEEIRAWHQRGALAEDHGLEDDGLISAARTRFGSWRNALVTAGILTAGEKTRRRCKWTNQRIIEAIQDRYVRGLPLRGDKHPRLASAALRRFGSWHAALEAAGLHMQGGRKRHRPRRKWTPESVLREIRTRQEQGLKTTSVGRTDGGLAAAARKHFGSWHNALAAAGLAEGDKDR